jgi:hypothetical protein
MRHMPSVTTSLMRPIGARLVLPLLLVSLLAFAVPVRAADTGLVVLKNGSRIAGEVKSLQMGKLEVSTISMGVVYVEWDKVIELTAPDYFEVELATGARYYGTLGPAAGAMLGVTLDGHTDALAMLAVVRLRRLKQSFWGRLDGSINLGASYTQSSGIGQASVSANVGARRQKFEWSAKGDSSVTVQPDEPEQTRATFSGAYNRLLPNRWFVLVSGKAEHNSEIGLQLRSAANGGAGRYLIQTNRSLFGAAGGISVNREIPVEGDSTTNTEAFVAASYEFFTYDTPKTSITVTFAVYPSLNVGGRVRTDADLSLKREIFADFTIGATLYDTYDSKPPTEGSKKHDLGFTLSVGWVF